MRLRNPRITLPGVSALGILLLVAPALGQAIADPFPAPIPKSSVVVELDVVASGLVAPIGATHADDGSDRLFVFDQLGEISVVEGGTQSATAFLDLSSEIGAIPPFSERGLIGLAFHPDFGNAGTPGAGRFYTHHSSPGGGTADFTVPLNAGETFDHQAVITEWTMTDPGAATFSGSRREIMRVDQPQNNHNGGQLAFAPDGTLLIGFGDGGAADDVGAGHGATGNGQDPTTVLGNVLRIDPLGTNSANGAYGIPADNPFVGSASALSEILYSGVRNPFRFSIDVDPATSDATIWLPDVGQGTVEEINRLSFLGDAGANLGWNLKEGSFKFVPGVGIVGDTTGLPASLSVRRDPANVAEELDSIHLGHAEIGDHDGEAALGLLDRSQTVGAALLRSHIEVSAEVPSQSVEEIRIIVYAQDLDLAGAHSGSPPCAASRATMDSHSGRRSATPRDSR